MSIFDRFKKENREPIEKINDKLFLENDSIYDMLTKFFKRSEVKLTDEDIKRIYDAFIILINRNNIDINNIKYLGSGEASIVFEVNDSVIKFCTSMQNGVSISEYVDDSKLILKPDDEEDIIDMYYNRFPNFKFTMCVLLEEKLKPSNITRDYLFTIQKKLLLDGYNWTDLKGSNIGIDHEGNYKLMDYGQLNRLNKLNYDNNKITRK